jgi:hypothetical protein
MLIFIQGFIHFENAFVLQISLRKTTMPLQSMHADISDDLMLFRVDYLTVAFCLV